jgi:hypothetical protein
LLAALIQLPGVAGLEIVDYVCVLRTEVLFEISAGYCSAS